MAADPSKPTNLDPGSPEYLCKVHGKCNMKTGADPTPADRSEGPVSPQLEDAKSFHEATEEAGLPNPKNMNPASEEFMCKIHGQCNAPNATAISRSPTPPRSPQSAARMPCAVAKSLASARGV